MILPQICARACEVVMRCSGVSYRVEGLVEAAGVELVVNVENT